MGLVTGGAIRGAATGSASEKPGTGSLGWSTGPNPQFAYQTAGTAAAYRSSKTALNALTVYYAQSRRHGRFQSQRARSRPASHQPQQRAAASDGDPVEAAAGAVRLALLPDDGPTGQFFSWDGSAVPC
jgi:hypothetical protein